ncbi:MAG: hypothetical protein KGZ97_03135 [Bacteroidetes bacterium]|nr:hypothetical protein [Bacteroidota bacterium]
MSFFAVILVFLIFGLIIKFSPFFKGIPQIKFHHIIVAFFIKCISGFVLLHIYSNYYNIETADVFKYFNDGMIMKDALWKAPADFFRMITGINGNAEHLNDYYSQMVGWFRPWDEHVYNDNRIIIRFNAILGVFSGGNIKVHIIVANFLSLVGLIALVKFFKDKINESKSYIAFWGILLFPSLLFWSSGILKENILLFALGLFLLNLDLIISLKKRNTINIIMLIISIALLLFMKAYIFILIIPLLATYYLFKRFSNFSAIGLYVGVFSLWIVFLFALGYLYLGYSPLHVIAEKQNNFVRFAIDVEAGSLISQRLMQPNLSSILSFIPVGFWNTLTRPHFLDGNSIIILFAALENIMIWIIVFYIIISAVLKKQFNSFVLFCLAFVVVTFTFVGMTAPIYGSLVRYKIFALPFLWIAFINLLDFKYRKNV